MDLDKKFAEYKKKKQKSSDKAKVSKKTDVFGKNKKAEPAKKRSSKKHKSHKFSWGGIFKKKPTSKKKQPDKEHKNVSKLKDKYQVEPDKKKKFSVKDLFNRKDKERSDKAKDAEKKKPLRDIFKRKKSESSDKADAEPKTPKAEADNNVKELSDKYQIKTAEKKKFRFKNPFKIKKEDKLEKKLQKQREELEKPEQSKQAKEGIVTRIKHKLIDKKAKKNLEEKPEKGKKETGEVKETDIRKLFKKQAKEKKKKLSAAERKRRLSDYLEKSGLEIDQVTLSKRIFQAAIILTTILTIIYVYMSVINKSTLVGIFAQVLIIWIIGFVSLWGASWIAFRIYLDLLMFRRKLSLEEVLPDFLQLTSANLRAGMPIDRALWFAVRPRFGVLAKEIEDTAKRTLSGEDLHEALLNFAKKYDSQILTRSIYLLNEGMEAGGDVADLLNKIALNIQEMRAMKKEMSANVTTYVIFISFAAMLAAPFLFGLSAQLLAVVQSIAGNVAGNSGSQATSGGIGLTINLSEDAIKMEDYQIFAYISLSISSIFSGVIVAAIKKGNVKEGLHYIPLFWVVSIIAYFLATKILGSMFAGMF